MSELGRMQIVYTLKLKIISTHNFAEKIKSLI